MAHPGQIVILNGTPRSGKSSIVRVIQAEWDGLWMNLGVDGFMAMTPDRLLPGMGLRPGGGERPEVEAWVAQLYLALYGSIAAHSRQGINVVVDVGHHDAYAKSLRILPRCAALLDGLPAWLIGVRCPLDVIMQRRRATGWNPDWADGDPVPAPILRWQTAVHQPGIYDLEVDTSQLSPRSCAAAIRARIDQGPPPSALAQLATLFSQSV